MYFCQTRGAHEGTVVRDGFDGGMAIGELGMFARLEDRRAATRLTQRLHNPKDDAEKKKGLHAFACNPLI